MPIYPSELKLILKSLSRASNANVLNQQVILIYLL